MTDADWAAVAACASTVSATVSLISIWFARRAALSQAKAADFKNCLETIEQLAEAQRKVRDAPPERHAFEFRELLNLMEGLALLFNDRKVAPSTRKIVEHFLEEAWAWLRADPAMSALATSSLTGADTYAELRRFAEARRPRIESLTRMYRDEQP